VCEHENRQWVENEQQQQQQQQQQKISFHVSKITTITTFSYFCWLRSLSGTTGGPAKQTKTKLTAWRTRPKIENRAARAQSMPLDDMSFSSVVADGRFSKACPDRSAAPKIADAVILLTTKGCAVKAALYDSQASLGEMTLKASF
jgi:hypothetical protein